jgi:hypothetical protein
VACVPPKSLSPAEMRGFFIRRFSGLLYGACGLPHSVAWANPLYVEARNAGRIHVTRRQLEVYREDATAQLSWARRHGADRELLDVLCSHIDRLSAKIEQLPPANQLASPRTSRRYAA